MFGVLQPAKRSRLLPGTTLSKNKAALKPDVLGNSSAAVALAVACRSCIVDEV